MYYCSQGALKNKHDQEPMIHSALRAIKKALSAKTLAVHFLIVFITALVICSLLYVFVIPVLYWMSFGEGAESERIESLPVNIFIGNWGALIVVLLACVTGIYFQLNRNLYSQAKSFLLTGILLIVIYLFRFQIGDVVIGIFHY